MNIKYIKPLFYSEDKVPAFIRKLGPRSNPKFIDFYNKNLYAMVERLKYDIERYKNTNDGHISREQHEVNICTLWYIRTDGGRKNV
jgi:hypothetical protein